VLGVAPSATLDDIETTYRQLLRAHHPDLHHDDSEAELAAAEARTRDLNQAIALIRAGWRPSSRWDGGFRVDDTTDWFGYPHADDRTAQPIECPLCRSTFDDPGVFRLHLDRVHHLRADTFMAAPRVRTDRLHWMAWIPAPPLTFGALLFVYLVVVIPLLDWPWTVPAIWTGIILTALGMIASIRRRSVY